MPGCIARNALITAPTSRPLPTRRSDGYLHTLHHPSRHRKPANSLSLRLDLSRDRRQIPRIISELWRRLRRSISFTFRDFSSEAIRRETVACSKPSIAAAPLRRAIASSASFRRALYFSHLAFEITVQTLKNS